MPQTVNVPTSITHAALLEVCRLLGLTESLDDLAALHIDVQGVRAELWARDENGRRYGAGTVQQPAKHVVSIPLVH